MFKFAVVIFTLIACTAAKPGLIGGPAHAVVIASPAPIVTATSSQYIARNHNGITVAHVIAPLAGPAVGHSIGAPLAFSAPLNYAAAPAPVLL